LIALRCSVSQPSAQAADHGPFSRKIRVRKQEDGGGTRKIIKKRRRNSSKKKRKSFAGKTRQWEDRVCAAGRIKRAFRKCGSGNK
jgi:hypothetical protein